jgi:hypothetical protein
MRRGAWSSGGTRRLRRAAVRCVADDPRRHRGRHAVALRALPRLRHKPGDRHSDDRPSSAGVGREPRARAALFVVPGFGADAGDHRVARVAAGREFAVGGPWCA